MKSSVFRVERPYRHGQYVHRNRRELVCIGAHLDSEVDVIMGEGKNNFFSSGFSFLSEIQIRGEKRECTVVN